MRTSEVAVVTGANRGVGREVVRRLAARGVTTVLGSRDANRGREAARGMTGPVVVRELDVADPDSVAALADWLRADPDSVDVLVNNAGVHYDNWQTAAEADLGVVNEALAVNVIGAWRTAVALVPLLQPGGRLSTSPAVPGPSARSPAPAVPPPTRCPRPPWTC